MRAWQAFAALALMLLVACEQGTPRPSSTPVAIAPSPSQSPFSIDTRVPVGAEWDVALPPGSTLEFDATWTKLVAIQTHPATGIGARYRMIVADAPDHAWRTAYEAPPGMQLRGLSGGDAHWTFIEERIEGSIWTVDARYIDLATGIVEHLGRTTLDQTALGRLPQRVRPTVVSDFGFVAWTRIRVDGGALIWELFETVKHVPGARVRLVRASRDPIVLLATNGAIAFVIATTAGDELWVHNTVTGWESVWARGPGVAAAAWSTNGLVVARSDLTSGSVVVIDAQLAQHTIVAGQACSDVAAYGALVTWRCGAHANDLRAYDLASSRFLLVGRTGLAQGYRVGDKGFVWLERNGPKDVLHLLALPL